MLGYYTSVLAVLLTTNHDNNSFLSGIYILQSGVGCKDADLKPSVPPNGDRIQTPPNIPSRVVLRASLPPL